ncbi:ATP-binding protein [Kitasatospora sp. NPDC005856]|uniref:ATP-binding protein n=1 Tax=Kitasatospora sp. NPDC005856 TaxID=3154566 RepID=UPI0033CCB0E0
MSTAALRLEGRRCYSREVAAFVAELAGRAGLSRGQTYRLRLAADELTTNAVVHGYRGGAGAIELAGCVAEEWVRLLIDDEAAPFDPSGHDPAPRLAAGPAAGPVGGYGLLLVRHSVDDFAYEYVDGRNRCTLTVRR